MATDLVGNEKLQRFIQLLSDLNHETVAAIRTGDTQVLRQMNDTVEEMHAIQSVGEEDAYTAIEDEMQTIVQNFNAIVMMMQSNEGATPDKATSTAVKKFLHNIFDGTVGIVTKYGLC